MGGQTQEFTNTPTVQRRRPTSFFCHFRPLSTTIDRSRPPSTTIDHYGPQSTRHVRARGKCVRGKGNLLTFLCVLRLRQDGLRLPEGPHPGKRQGGQGLAEVRHQRRVLPPRRREKAPAPPSGRHRDARGRLLLRRPPEPRAPEALLLREPADRRKVGGELRREPRGVTKQGKQHFRHAWSDSAVNAQSRSEQSA
jgi:hypothetical protein